MSELITDNILDNQLTIGDSSVFAIRYAFTGKDRMTEISMFVDGVNILGFVNGKEHCTLRWAYLEGLVGWLKDFAVNMCEDPLPVDTRGDYAKERFSNALEAGPENEDEFEEYALPLWEWTESHSWLNERAGAILPDVFFELRDGLAELSWDNRASKYGVAFDYEIGGGRVAPEIFKAVVFEFADAYEQRWGIKVDDESTWVRKD